ncbi:GDP-D-glucose phosphorylase 1-like isoform X2 [Babylonia areolata]
MELRKKWDRAMKGGAFRYDIDHITTRIIPGPKHYVAQLNLLRAKERRKPQDIRSISQPFSPKEFNFTRVPLQEVVFNLRHSSGDGKMPVSTKPVASSVAEVETGEEKEEATAGDTENCSVVTNGFSDAQEEKSSGQRHALVINVSPMEYGHCLLVPQIDCCLPQIVTETSVNVALEMLLLSHHRGYRLGFNSLCAFASVNHLHYHAYYLEYELVVEYAPVTHLLDSLYEMTTIPVPGFAFQLHGSAVSDISRKVHKVCNYLQEADIAHNLFICRGVVFGEERNSAKTTIRVFIWPRRKFIGTKSAEEFNVASIELGGHLPIREKDGYHSLTEEAVDDIIADSQLPVEHYQQIKKDVMALFTPSL